MYVIGLLSGTSADGIDAAMCDISQDISGDEKLSVRIIHGETVPYPPDVRTRVLAAMCPGGMDAAGLCVLNVEIGEAFADAAQRVITASGITPDLIGSHGQTLWHEIGADGKARATLQMGESAVIAERTGVTVISNFRARDIAAGGQGAPLVGYLDWLLLRHETHWRAVQNIGGIGNITFLPPLNSTTERTASFDTGPGNALIDSAVAILTDGAQTYDNNGEWAARGHVVSTWLEDMLDHKYFERIPPKSTGRELFGTDYAAELVRFGRERGLGDADIIATITALTAFSIADACRQFAFEPVRELILAGGGRHNAALVTMLRDMVAPTEVLFSDQISDAIDGDFKEALLFAVLAYQTWHNRPGTLPAHTGARHASVLGSITPGSNYGSLLPLLLRKLTATPD